MKNSHLLQAPDFLQFSLYQLLTSHPTSFTIASHPPVKNATTYTTNTYRKSGTLFRHLIFHNNLCINNLSIFIPSNSSRRYTSGAKSAWKAVFRPDVICQENWDRPQRALHGRLGISQRYTSGAKRAWKANFRPNVTRQENRKQHRGV